MKTKVIIAGGRDFTKPVKVDMAMGDVYGHDVLYDNLEVVCGGARGADTEGQGWAERHGVDVKMFPADWDKHGRAAGPIRNSQMGDYADVLVAFWDEKSKGTAHMIKDARKKGLRVYVFNYDGVLIEN